MTRSMPRAGGGHDDHPHVSQAMLVSFVGGWGGGWGRVGTRGEEENGKLSCNGLSLRPRRAGAGACWNER